jgi:hypothetical protein
MSCVLPLLQKECLGSHLEVKNKLDVKVKVKVKVYNPVNYFILLFSFCCESSSRIRVIASEASHAEGVPGKRGNLLDGAIKKIASSPD